MRVSQIFAGDKRRLDEVLGGQGWRYVLGAILIFPLTLIKVVDFLIKYKFLLRCSDSALTPEDKELAKKRVEMVTQLEDYANLYPEARQDHAKITAIQRLQSKFSQDLMLKGKMIRVEHTTDGVVQRITFGNNVNAELKSTFPLLKLKKLKGEDITYFVFEGNELFQLEAKLRTTFMRPVTITVKKNEE